MIKAWENEPDRVEFEYYGYDCILNRNDLGAWCGYVAVPKSHPDYHKDYCEVPVDVHGELTYANKCEGKIRHIDKTTNYWWFGFDCAHSGDLIPAMYTREEKERDPIMMPRKLVYRDFNYVWNETRSLAYQLKAREKEER